MLTSKVLSQIAFENIFGFPGGVSCLPRLEAVVMKLSFAYSVDFGAWQEFNKYSKNWQRWKEDDDMLWRCHKSHETSFQLKIVTILQQNNFQLSVLFLVVTAWCLGISHTTNRGPSWCQQIYKFLSEFRVDSRNCVNLWRLSFRDP